MPILSDVEIWYVKCNPKRPNAKHNKKNPTWEAQVRTRDKAQREYWNSLGLAVKSMIPDDGAAPYWYVNLRKKSIKEKDGEAASPVSVVDGNLADVDPDTIGNGSNANVRIYQYEYGDEGKKASVLMGIQLTRHIVYTPKPRDDEFGTTTTERIVPQKPANDEGEMEADEHEGEGFKKAEVKSPTPSAPKKAVAGF
jgi:hypothetical protein